MTRLVGAFEDSSVLHSTESIVLVLSFYFKITACHLVLCGRHKLQIGREGISLQKTQLDF